MKVLRVIQRTVTKKKNIQRVKIRAILTSLTIKIEPSITLPFTSQIGSNKHLENNLEL